MEHGQDSTPEAAIEDAIVIAALSDKFGQIAWRRQHLVAGQLQTPTGRGIALIMLCSEPDVFDLAIRMSRRLPSGVTWGEAIEAVSPRSGEDAAEIVKHFARLTRRREMALTGEADPIVGLGEFAAALRGKRTQEGVA